MGVLVVSPRSSRTAETYRYEFEQPNFLVTRIVIVLDAEGRGTLEYVEKDVPEPTRAPVTLRPESLARLRRLAEQVASLPPAPPSEKHANLGLSKLSLVVNGQPVVVAFTYTPHPALLELGQFFRGLITQHQRVSQIEVARRYQPLDVPKLLRDLEADLNANRIAEPAALGDLLASLVMTCGCRSLRAITPGGCPPGLAVRPESLGARASHPQHGPVAPAPCDHTTKSKTRGRVTRIVGVTFNRRYATGACGCREPWVETHG